MPQHDPLPRRAAPDPLADPGYAPHAWARFKGILRWMTVAAVLCGGAAIALLWHMVGPLPIHMAIATFLCVSLSIMMAALLMGLIFLSSGSGHDEAVEHFDEGDTRRR